MTGAVDAGVYNPAIKESVFSLMLPGRQPRRLQFYAWPAGHSLSIAHSPYYWSIKCRNEKRILRWKTNQVLLYWTGKMWLSWFTSKHLEIGPTKESQSSGTFNSLILYLFENQNIKDTQILVI